MLEFIKHSIVRTVIKLGCSVLIILQTLPNLPKHASGKKS
jgi:hypothetical protein